MENSETITIIPLGSKTSQCRNLHQSLAYKFFYITLGEFHFGFEMKLCFLHIHNIPGVRALKYTVQQRQTHVFSRAEIVGISYKMRFSFKNIAIKR